MASLQPTLMTRAQATSNCHDLNPILLQTQTADGRLIEVEDDELPTDSDDESSDDDDKRAARQARKHARVASAFAASALERANSVPYEGGAAAEYLDGHQGGLRGGNSSGSGNGSVPTRLLGKGGGWRGSSGPLDAASSAAGGALGVELSPKSSSALTGGAKGGRLDMPAENKTAQDKHTQRRAYHKALLKAEQLKATEGLAGEGVSARVDKGERSVP